ncbi:MAG: hypothetical protein AAFV80_00795, partial [Bacteroidota bacterium]
MILLPRFAEPFLEVQADELRGRPKQQLIHRSGIYCFKGHAPTVAGACAIFSQFIQLLNLKFLLVRRVWCF